MDYLGGGDGEGVGVILVVEGCSSADQRREDGIEGWRSGWHFAAPKEVVGMY